MQSNHDIYKLIDDQGNAKHVGSWASCYEWREKNDPTYDKTKSGSESWTIEKLFDTSDYSQSSTVQQYINQVIDNVEESHGFWLDGEEEWIEYGRTDAIYELTDNIISVYTAELLNIALEDLTLATEEPESFGGEYMTPAQAITANISEAVNSGVHDYYEAVANAPVIRSVEITK